MNEPSSRQSSATNRPSLKRLLVVLAFCVLLGGGVQLVSAINDNSTQNAVTLIACGIALGAVVIWCYRLLATRLSRPVAALAVLAVLLVPVLAFRIRGFTGEIVPQLELRFSADRRLPDETAQADAAGEPLHLASTAFPQFLGPRRNAVIPRREFAVPTSSDLQPLWTQPVGEGWAGFAIAGERCVTLEQRAEQECVSCYRLGDGALLWLNQIPARHEDRFGGIGPRSTPRIADDKVFVQGATGIVQCLDLASGEVIWRQDLLQLAGWSQQQSESEISWGRSGSPLLTDQFCVLPFGGPDDGLASGDAAADQSQPPWQGRSLIALDRADGAVRWTAGEDQISFASPMRMTLAGTDQIVSVNERTVSGHAIDDGRQLWSTRWSGRSNGAANCAAAVAVDEHAFLVGKAYGTGSGVFEVVAEQNGFAVQQRWARPSVLKTKFTHACVVGRFAYGLSDGVLECVDLTDGQRAWAQPRGSRYGHGHVILVEDVLVVQCEAGEVAFVAARSDRFEELATLPALDSKTWNIPAVAGRYLAVRNDVQASVYLLPPRSDEPTPDAEPTPSGEAEAAQTPAAASQPPTPPTPPVPTGA